MVLDILRDVEYGPQSLQNSRTMTKKVAHAYGEQIRANLLYTSSLKGGALS